MLLHLIQLAIETPQPERNRARVLELVRGAGVAPRSLIVLPELFGTGTLPPDFEASDASRIAEEDRSFLAALARETGSHVVAGILGGANAGELQNLCVILSPEGAEIASYRKIHPFSLGGEDKHFAGGDSVSIAAVEGFTLQAAVCYDLRFPELFRAGARRGTDLIVVPANWPGSRKEHWEILLRARAIENQSFVAGVNCVGTQRGTAYAGGSLIVSPKGEVLAAGGNREDVVSAEISADHVTSWRRVFPALRDRKPDGFWEKD